MGVGVPLHLYNSENTSLYRCNRNSDSLDSGLYSVGPCNYSSMPHYLENTMSDFQPENEEKEWMNQPIYNEKLFSS